MAAPAKKAVELFYDVLSPYSWIGFELMCRYQQKWNIDLQLKPFLLGAIMVKTENIPPGLNSYKAKYGEKDLHWARAYFQVPLKAPTDFVGEVMQKGSLAPQRLLTATKLTQPQYLEDLSRSLWMRVWGNDQDITEPSSLLEACRSAGISEADSETLVSKIKDPEVKEELKRTTEEALGHGAFGSPIIVVQGEDGKKNMVFGSDRMHIVGMLLGEKYVGPLNEIAKTKL